MPHEPGDVFMRKKEQRLWDSLKRNKPPHIELERIENLVGEGIPDVLATAMRRMCWLELKAATLPARSTTRLLGPEGLRQSQLNWGAIARRFRLPVYVLIRDDRKQLFMVHCDHFEALNNMTVGEIIDVSVASTWAEIFDTLTNGTEHED